MYTISIANNYIYINVYATTVSDSLIGIMLFILRLYHSFLPGHPLPPSNHLASHPKNIVENRHPNPQLKEWHPNLSPISITKFHNKYPSYRSQTTIYCCLWIFFWYKFRALLSSKPWGFIYITAVKLRKFTLENQAKKAPAVERWVGSNKNIGPVSFKQDTHGRPSPLLWMWCSLSRCAE